MDDQQPALLDTSHASDAHAHSARPVDAPNAGVLDCANRYASPYCMNDVAWDAHCRLDGTRTPSLVEPTAHAMSPSQASATSSSAQPLECIVPMNVTQESDDSSGSSAVGSTGCGSGSIVTSAAGSSPSVPWESIRSSATIPRPFQASPETPTVFFRWKDRHRLVTILGCVTSQLFRTLHNQLPTNPAEITRFHSAIIPSITIEQYLERLAYYSACSNEALTLSFIYLSRVFQAGESSRLNIDTLRLSQHSMHRLLLVCIMSAAKFHDDAHRSNLYWSGYCCIQNRCA